MKGRENPGGDRGCGCERMAGKGMGVFGVRSTSWRLLFQTLLCLSVVLSLIILVFII